jgi:hypothetical protein
MKSYAKKYSLNSWLEEVMRKSFIYYEVVLKKYALRICLGKKICAKLHNCAKIMCKTT